MKVGCSKWRSAGHTQPFQQYKGSLTIKTAMQTSSAGPFIDIGANLLDSMYQGVYNGSQKHLPDLMGVLERAWANGVEKIIVTAGNLDEARQALELCRTDPRLFCTMGVHPTRCGDFEKSGDAEVYFAELVDLCLKGKEEGKVVAVGEFGLDYDRLFFCEKDTQRVWFERQFELAERADLPLFLHDRNTNGEFLEIIQRNRDRFKHGVVHSFTGTKEEAEQLTQLGLFIGINGCSLKTEENLEVLKSIPLEKIMFETDAPWCEIKQSHAGYGHIRTHFQSKKNSKFETGICVKSRCEPCHIVQVAEVAAAVLGKSLDETAAAAYTNTELIFFGSTLGRHNNSI